MARPKGSKDESKKTTFDAQKLTPEARIELLANLLVERIAEELKTNAVSK